MATLTIPDTVFSELSHDAKARGISVEQLVLQKLQTPVSPAPETMASTAAERRRILDEMRQAALDRADRYPPGFRVDDSRETIYGEQMDHQR